MTKKIPNLALVSEQVLLYNSSKFRSVGKMSQPTFSQNSQLQMFLEELRQEISNPLHKRLLQAYQGQAPVQSMETELTKILLEVLHRED